MALIFGFMLISGTASAFDCARVSLPSSIVICSDPELVRLADERQKAFNEARWGLDPERDEALLADQRRWVQSYPTACGVNQNAPPPSLPVPKVILECFRQAALARIAFIRAFRLSVSASTHILSVAPLRHGPAESTDTLPDAAIQFNNALRHYCASHSPLACSQYDEDTNSCLNEAENAFPILVAERQLIARGETPQSAVRFAAENIGYPNIAARAANVPSTISPEQFKNQVMRDCLKNIVP